MASLGIKDSVTKLEDVRQYIATDKNYFSILNRPIQDMIQRDEDLDLIHKPSRSIRARATDPTSDQVEVEAGTYTFGNLIQQFTGTTLTAVPAASAGNKRIDLVYFRIDTGTVVRSPSAEAANYGSVTKPSLPAGLDTIPLAFLYVGETGPVFADGLAVNNDNAIEDIRPAPGSSMGRQVETSAANLLSDVNGGAAGSSERIARADHRHNLNVDATLPASLLPGNSAAVGTAGTYARRDHVHLIPTEANPAAFLSDISGGSAGVGATFARSDHRHELNAGGVAPPADAGSGSAGASGVYARSDHFHALNVPVGGTPAAVSPAATATHGVAATYARSDHVHDVEGVIQGGQTGGVLGVGVWGEVDSAGAIQLAGSGGWSVARNSTGNYTITFSPAFSSVPVFVATAFGTTSNRYVIAILSKTTSSVNVSILFSGGLVDRDFSFFAIGV